VAGDLHCAELKPMKVDGVFHLFDRSSRDIVITGLTLWQDNIIHNTGDVLSCGTKKWKVIAVDRIQQGCFRVPTIRYHSIRLEPIDHLDCPNIGDHLMHCLM
jgi:hypothetical protein